MPIDFPGKNKAAGQLNLGSRKKLNTQRLRRISVHFQGVSMGAYCPYAIFGATLIQVKR
jgi:hypothetical protein